MSLVNAKANLFQYLPLSQSIYKAVNMKLACFNPTKHCQFSLFTARTTITTTAAVKRKRKTAKATATERLTATIAAMSTATCARFCGPLTGANKTSASPKGGSSSKLTAGTGSNMTSSALQHKKQIPTATTNDNNTEATFTFKLGRATVDSHVSHASSESSDPLESDYSEETEEDEQPHQKKPAATTQSKHVSASVSSRSSSSATTASVDNDGDEVDDEEDADEDGGHETDDVVTNNDDSEESEQDDGNETDDEETDEESEESSSVQTAKGVRKYHLDDYQIIKTVGEYDMPIKI